MWAEIIIQSRGWQESLGGDIDAGAGGDMLLPILDMLNTDYLSKQNVHLDFGSAVDGRPLTLTAKVAMPAGTELIDDYGLRQSNEDFVFSYGFLLPNHPNVLDPILDPRCLGWTAAISENCSCSAPPEFRKQEGAYCTLSFLSLEYCQYALSAPAQKCWTVLTRVPPEEDLTPYVGEMKVFFRSVQPDPVQIVWVPESGDRVIVADLNRDDGVRVIRTSPGHTFEALRAGGPPFGPFVASRYGEAFTIGAQVMVENRGNRAEL